MDVQLLIGDHIFVVEAVGRVDGEVVLKGCLRRRVLHVLLEGQIDAAHVVGEAVAGDLVHMLIRFGLDRQDHDGQEQAVVKCRLEGLEPVQLWEIHSHSPWAAGWTSSFVH